MNFKNFKKKSVFFKLFMYDESWINFFPIIAYEDFYFWKALVNFKDKLNRIKFSAWLFFFNFYIDLILVVNGISKN